MNRFEKPYSPACDRNREPILAVLQDHFADRRSVLEIGSGTGQHAAFFAAQLPHLLWQSSDLADNLPGIRAWLAEAALPNTADPLELDIRANWPNQRFDAAFTANTLHIMGWDEVERLFEGVGQTLRTDGKFVVYGPFNYGGRYTSDSNAQFDAHLKARDLRQGIREFEAVTGLAAGIGMALVEDVAMPANNRCLVWHRVSVNECI